MKKLIAMILGFAAVQSHAQATPTALRSEIERTVQAVFALGGSPGIGVVVVRDTTIIYAGGAGYADVEAKIPFEETTPFYIASTTKSFTGLAAAILAERGMWSLDAPLAAYLPGITLQSPLDARTITIRDLLTHTHGIGNFGPVVMRLAYTGEYRSNEELIAVLNVHAPTPDGRQFRYSNLGYNVAAFAMERVTKETWKETLARLLFAPLQMRATTAYISKVDTARLAKPYRFEGDTFVRRHLGKNDATMQSAGGLITTPTDMGRWLLMHINGGRANGAQAVPRASVAESRKVLASVNQQGPSGQRTRYVGYGLGWMVGLRGSDTMLVHGGGFPGYATHMSFMVQHRIGVSVMANNSQLGGAVIETLASALYDVVQSGRPLHADSIAAIRALLDDARKGVAEDRARRAARSQTLPHRLDAYVGTYVNPQWGRLTIGNVGGRLEARMGVARSAVEVFDASKNQLRLELFGSGMVFTVGMTGDRATTITMLDTHFRREPE